MVVIAGVITYALKKRKNLVYECLNRVCREARGLKEVTKVILNLATIKSISLAASTGTAARWKIYFSGYSSGLAGLLLERFVLRGAFIVTLRDRRIIGELRLLSKEDMKVVYDTIRNRIARYEENNAEQWKIMMEKTALLCAEPETTVVSAFEYFYEILIA